MQRQEAAERVGEALLLQVERELGQPLEECFYPLLVAHAEIVYAQRGIRGASPGSAWPTDWSPKD